MAQICVLLLALGVLATSVAARALDETSTSLPVATATAVENPPTPSKSINKSANIEELKQFGDIILTPRQKFIIKMANSSSPLMRNRAVGTFARKWPQNIVPYQISSEFTQQEKNLIIQTLSDLGKVSCFKFPYRTSSHSNYVNVRKLNGCYSLMGMKGGEQTLSLGAGCVFRASIQHEFLHALGFMHEMQRPDRDAFVNIYWYDEIVPFQANDFSIIGTESTQNTNYSWQLTNTAGYAYDVHSFAFPKQKGMTPTITDKQGRTLPYSELSQLDIYKMTYAAGTNCKMG